MGKRDSCARAVILGRAVSFRNRSWRLSLRQARQA
jgi:hypothetical protein